MNYTISLPNRKTGYRFYAPTWEHAVAVLDFFTREHGVSLTLWENR